MATGAQWATAYARQADADFQTFQSSQDLSIPECHRQLFLQMACEKRVRAHLCGRGTDPVDVRASHALYREESASHTSTTGGIRELPRRESRREASPSRIAWHDEIELLPGREA